ncbi:hypothetical protein C3L33_15613, partial [Rhododendron williamsianum]
MVVQWWHCGGGGGRGVVMVVVAERWLWHDSSGGGDGLMVVGVERSIGGGSSGGGNSCSGCSVVMEESTMAVVEPKIIIDTDPGIDDAMAVFVALRSPEVEVIGLTTIYGIVYTTLATRICICPVFSNLEEEYILCVLVELVSITYNDEKALDCFRKLLMKGTKLRIADFVHGADGLGNQNFPLPVGKPVEQSAAAFLVEQANLYPGKVTVLVYQLMQAIQLDPAFTKNIGQIVVLGGAVAVNGNVNPAAEANVVAHCLSTWTASVNTVSSKPLRMELQISKSSGSSVIVVTLKFDVLNVLGVPGLDQIFGDPEAVDIVFTSGADVLAVGINVTHQVVLTGNILCHLHIYVFLNV